MRGIKTITVRSAGLILLIAFFVLIVLPLGLKFSNDDCRLHRIRPTRLRLSISRGHIDDIAKRTGRFPSSLLELRAYVNGLPDQGLVTRPVGEFISRREGDYSDHRELDSTGGMYYNPATGEIRVNLAKPVKCYLRTYFGERRNEVPADW